MRFTFILTAALVLAPSVAMACAVCGTGPERSREAYINMTAFMTLLPLSVVGALVWLFVRRWRRLEAEELAAPREPLREPSRP